MTGDPEGIRSVEYFFRKLYFEFNFVPLINFSLSLSLSLFIYIYIYVPSLLPWCMRPEIKLEPTKNSLYSGY